jgi:hypothetical protein
MIKTYMSYTTRRSYMVPILGFGLDSHLSHRRCRRYSQRSQATFARSPAHGKPQLGCKS